MREDQPSSTASIVAAARAATHVRPTIRDFSDPYAEELLPPWYAVTDGSGGQRAFARTFRRVLRGGAHVIALRMVAIDDAIRSAPKLEQLVILGAGLDARAWRMSELASVPVFEIDHPATQRYKRERAARFPARRDHHYVSVDFETESLAEKLADSAHDPDLATIWIWEGVTMYLHSAAVEATLTTISERSARGSRLIVSYLPPSFSRLLVGLGTSVHGERLRATYEQPEMAALLEKFEFEVESDESAVQWHERWALPNARLMPGFATTERLATANRS